WGFGSPPQITDEGQAWFYLKRLFLFDPVLIGAAALALLRCRNRVVIAWIVIVLFSVMAFQYRNATYLLPLFPALVLVVISAVPKRLGGAALACVLLLAGYKVLTP